MNQKEYQEEVNKIKTENKPTFIQSQTNNEQSNEYLPKQGKIEENREKHKKYLEDHKEEIQQQKAQQQEVEYNERVKTTTELLQGEDNPEQLPDITEFLKTEEYLRMGTDYKIPIPITMPNGQQYKIYIRSINSNEYYQYQLKQVREKKSMNYLVAVDICEDSKGNKLPKEFFEKIGFDYVEQIGEAISLASGTTGEDPRIQQVVENFLKN